MSASAQPKPPSSHTPEDQWITSRMRTGRQFTARDALICVGVAILLLLLFKGPSIKTQGERMKEGTLRDIVLAVGKPVSAVTKPLPFDNWSHSLFGWLSPDKSLSGDAGFDTPSDAGTAAGPAGGPGAITPAAFDPSEVGEKTAKRNLKKLLVTGDSLSQPLDTTLARRLAKDGVRTLREPHVGTGISKTLLLDWAKLSAEQASKEQPDAVVVFIGANEGFPMKGPTGKQVSCCNARWAAIYAGRVRRMMSTYRRAGKSHIYWLTLPATRSKNLEIVARTVNAAIKVAAAPYGHDVTVLDMVPVFTPNNKYRSAMNVKGTKKIVRESDGIHLNQTGADVAADVVLAAIDKDYDH